MPDDHTALDPRQAALAAAMTFVVVLLAHGAQVDWKSATILAIQSAALAGAISVLARDPALRLRFGAAGRRMAEKEFSRARIGKLVVDLYDSLLNRRPAPLPALAAGG